MTAMIIGFLPGVILGVILGWVTGVRADRRRDRAPVPQLPERPAVGCLPANLRRGEPVEVCGVTLWRM